eukprot:1160353-Pelagomonas_calceolata.AAC.1
MQREHPPHHLEVPPKGYTLAQRPSRNEAARLVEFECQTLLNILTNMEQCMGILDINASKTFQQYSVHHMFSAII